MILPLKALKLRNFHPWLVVLFQFVIRRYPMLPWPRREPVRCPRIVSLLRNTLGPLFSLLILTVIRGCSRSAPPLVKNDPLARADMDTLGERCCQGLGCTIHSYIRRYGHFEYNALDNKNTV